MSTVRGPLQLRAAFSAKRVRVADGPLASGAQHLPRAERWLVREHRATGERKLHLTNHPADTTLEQLAAAIKARWSCEQAHQQLKAELGLNHVEGRSWTGLHHHALLCQIAFAFLRSRRVGGKRCWPRAPGPPPQPSLPEVQRRVAAALLVHLTRCPHCRRPARVHMLL